MPFHKDNQNTLASHISDSGTPSISHIKAILIVLLAVIIASTRNTTSFLSHRPSHWFIRDISQEKIPQLSRVSCEIVTTGACQITKKKKIRKTTLVTDFLILLLGNPQGFLASRRNVKKKKAAESKKQKKNKLIKTDLQIQRTI